MKTRTMLLTAVLFATAIGCNQNPSQPADSGKPGAPTPRLYAGVSTVGESVFVSDDAGAHWRAVPGQPTAFRPSHMVRGGDYSSSKRGQKPTARAAAGDHFRSGSLGFRVAQDSAKK